MKLGPVASHSVVQIVIAWNREGLGTFPLPGRQAFTDSRRSVSTGYAQIRQAGEHFDSSPNFRVAPQTPTRTLLPFPAGRSVIVVSPMSEHSKFLLADSQIPS